MNNGAISDSKEWMLWVGNVMDEIPPSGCEILSRLRFNARNKASRGRLHHFMLKKRFRTASRTVAASAVMTRSTAPISIKVGVSVRRIATRLRGVDS